MLRHRRRIAANFGHNMTNVITSDSFATARRSNTQSHRGCAFGMERSRLPSRLTVPTDPITAKLQQQAADLDRLIAEAERLREQVNNHLQALQRSAIAEMKSPRERRKRPR
jgi:hypothetical protein